MNDSWIIVADGARARFLMVERDAGRPPRAALRLVENARVCSNPETHGQRQARRAPDQERPRYRPRQCSAARLHRSSRAA